MKTSLVFFGNEKLATGIAEPDRLGLKALEAAGYDIEAAITGKVEAGQTFESQIAVLAAYGHILPESLLELFPLGIINIHPSLLPIYRGPTPIEQAILNGETETGVSIMKLTRQMDAGPIYAQERLSLYGNESKQELANQLQHLGAELLVQVLPGIIDGRAEARAQDESKAAYCKKIAKADGKINWTKPAIQLEREIRAYLGWPGSYTNLLGSDVTITKARVLEDSGEAGKVFTTDAKELAIYAGEGALVIDSIKPSGKREMTAKEFLAGRKL